MTMPAALDIHTTPIARTLADIGPVWCEVAVRKSRPGWADDCWNWHLPLPERLALLKGREGGAYDTAQRRDGDGFVLPARRVVRKVGGR